MGTRHLGSGRSTFQCLLMEAIHAISGSWPVSASATVAQSAALTSGRGSWRGSTCRTGPRSHRVPPAAAAAGWRRRRSGGPVRCCARPGTSPQSAPSCHVPSPMTETGLPVRPRTRCSMICDPTSTNGRPTGVRGVPRPRMRFNPLPRRASLAPQSPSAPYSPRCAIWPEINAEHSS